MGSAKRVVLLVNPAAGRGRGARFAPEAMRRLQERGLAVETLQATSATDLRRLLPEVLAVPPAALVVCGGDGTVALALDELVATRVPLGIVPAGTGNDTARTLGLPGGARAAADVVADGLHDPARGMRVVDTGELTCAGGERRRFLSVVCTGFDALVNERANRVGWPTGRARYLRAVAEELRLLRAVPYRVVYDAGLATEHRVERTGLMVSVGNGPSYGGGMLICPGARLDDGRLSTTFVSELPRLVFLRVLPGVFRGTHVRREEILTDSAATVRVEAPGRLAYADGERAGRLPVTVRVDPASLRVLAPILAPPTLER